MNRSDLEKVAAKIIRLHISNGTTPEEAARCCCQESSLNDEQIKRVVEMANTGMFLEKFKGTSGAKDRFIDFDVIDPLSVIRKVTSMIPAGGPMSSSKRSLTVSISTPKGTMVRRMVNSDPGLDTDRSFFFDDIPNEKVAHFEGVPLDYDVPVDTRVKVASKEPEIGPYDQHKLQEALRTKIAEAEINCSELSSIIASKYRDIYSREKYASFEQDALSLFGPSATFVLQDVRSKLGMKKLSGLPSETHVKLASDRHISNINTPGIVEAGFYLENLKQFTKLSAALTPDAITAATAGLIGRDFVQPITNAAGYQLATKYGPSVFYRVKGYDRIMESLIDKGLDTAYDTVEGLGKDLKQGYNARAWKANRMLAVKKMLRDNPDIASADKDRVHQAVNTVARYAPKLSQDPALLTGMVNQMVHSEHSAIDPQTISELVKAEKEFRYIDKPTAYRG